MMKTAVVLFVMAVATVSEDKITPGVVQSLQQSSTANVAVALDIVSHVSGHTSLYNHAKCVTLDAVGGVFQCAALTKDEICSFAALPEVREIVAIVPFDSDITPKPADALTTTAATINLCPLNIIPKHTTDAATPSACDKPVEDVDFEGNDIKFTQRSNSDDCCDDCAKTPGCVVYVWTPWEDGTCFLKWKAGKSVHKWGAKAAKVANSVGSCQAAQANVDYNGNDIDRIYADKDDCCALCLKADNCKGYSHYQGYCYLKGELGNASYKEGVTSGVRD
ncbi:hypothetical protein DYB35_013223 [Aphanomyces astaci]|uniref:Apple domain-containing protein n=1 Tax=Aphanomyces astaci TaxID=112090 RepID=A0A3R7EHY7_APHAT|nr:hypothetical protein DYB35_013223 [Aphanomyces astaci]